MGDTSARRAMGLSELTQVCHGVLALLLSIWDRSSNPSRGNDTILEGHANVKERNKGKRSSLQQKGVRAYKDWTKRGKKPKSIATDTSKE